MYSSINNDAAAWFSFREAKTIYDLGALLRLRYHVYRASDLAGFIPENDYGIDVDCYDIRARQFGLFEVKSEKERAVGYLRVVEDRMIPAQRIFLSLVNGIPDLRRRLENTPAHPFPMMTYMPDPGIIDDLRESIRENGERLGEPCRFALDASVRSLRLARHMAESALAIYYFHYGVEHGVYCCDAMNAAFYRAYGYKVLEGTAVSDFVGIGEDSCCLHGSIADLPEGARDRLERMADAFEETGSICCVPGEPNQFHSPERAPDYNLIYTLSAA